jgi:hypothetical protein
MTLVSVCYSSSSVVGSNTYRKVGCESGFIGCRNHLLLFEFDKSTTSIVEVSLFRQPHFLNYRYVFHCHSYSKVGCRSSTDRLRNAATMFTLWKWGNDTNSQTTEYKSVADE